MMIDPTLNVAILIANVLVSVFIIWVYLDESEDPFLPYTAEPYWLLDPSAEIDDGGELDDDD